MSDKPEYAIVEPDIEEDDTEYPDVHLEALGLKFDLPNLNSKAELPLEIIQMIFILKSKVVLSDEEQYQAMAVFLAYFEQIHPTLWNRLRRSDNAMGWLTGIVKAWAAESGIDPKALTSSSSTRSTEER
ncbi:hypothetical protein BACT_0489 [Bifidobacterium actinocoloniiforme DSM 22766]|uniref:Uncharacterized protein n=1 Tax=Bifidobacterium actinocoloniiforme DSM 22766 TaxID=1437605 RepID=A0A086YZT9_9BIFI|nr:hypothetical protein [Bifidobacterium actinocoloniiforme]AKV55078.1 hypothetical protein AB656_01065 [Bifidobacterium actinocoloniiforme DSM 22766]KFI39789.1 hypothetical protein BACT_0489 [Bifidobacterium actinocoloniiforme DSM 22766]